MYKIYGNPRSKEHMKGLVGRVDGRIMLKCVLKNSVNLQAELFLQQFDVFHIPCINYKYNIYLKHQQMHFDFMNVQDGSNMTGTDLYVNKPHCAAAVRP